MTQLGIITPDVTSLGYISQEAASILYGSDLGIITPDVTQFLNDAEISLGGYSWQSWAAVLSLAALGAAAAGFVASKSAKGALLSGIGGVAGSAAGMYGARVLAGRRLKSLAPVVA